VPRSRASPPEAPLFDRARLDAVATLARVTTAFLLLEQRVMAGDLAATADLQALAEMLGRLEEHPVPVAEHPPAQRADDPPGRQDVDHRGMASFASSAAVP
jgi:hypothetical protein